MPIIKINSYSEIPRDYTGIVEWENARFWFKEGVEHREDGPSYIENKIGNRTYKEWWLLNGKEIWNSNYKKFDSTNKIILSKDPHPLYPTVQVQKYIDENGIQEQIIIPGMEPWFTE